MDETIYQSPVPAQSAATPPQQPVTPLSEAFARPSVPPPPPANGFPVGKILKIAAAVAVGILILFLLIGFVRSKFAGKTENVTLTYWGLWEDQSVMQPLLDDFHKKNPTITVKYVKQDINQYTDRLLTRIQNGTGPDVYRFHNTWLAFLAPYLLPLSKDVIAPVDFQKTYYPVALKDLSKNGALYGIPLEIDTLSLYINSDILEAAGEKPPVTWDDFRNLAYQMTVKDATTNKIKTAGAAIGTFDNISHAPDILSLLFVQSGVDPANITANSQNAITALTFYKNFAGQNDNDPNGVWNNTLDPSLLAFTKGSLGMYFGYSWDYFAIKAANPQLRFQIAPVPYPSGGQPMTLASYWAEGISSKTPHQKEALLFLQYLSRKETEQLFYTTAAKSRDFGEPYARVDLASLLQANDSVFPFISQAATAGSSFFVDSTYGQNDTNFNSRMNQYLGNAVRSLFSGTSADSAVGTLGQGVSQVLSSPYHGQ